MSEKNDFDKREIFNQLIKSTHGNLMNYERIVNNIATNDIEFLSHLMCWNLIKGEIRDSKVAIPVLTLRHLKKDDQELAENAIANLMSLDPKNFLKAYNFNKTLSANKKTIPAGYRKMLQEGLIKYLVARQENMGWWINTAVHHRKSLKALYTISHIKPPEFAQKILFDKEYPKNSIFEKISQLKNMSSKEAAGTILTFGIPAKIALGALNMKSKDIEKNPEIILSLLEGMSGQQLINNTKLLSDFGVFNSHILKSEYEKALSRAKKDKNVSTLKAGKAIDILKKEKNIDGVEVNKDVIERLSSLQESKINQRGVEGDWAILADASGSMSSAIETGIEIAAYLAKSIKGKVYLIFFNTSPRFIDVTGKTLEQIKSEVRYIKASGATSCGCGIDYLESKNISVNGIIMVSDGGDNRIPFFHTAYASYINKIGISPSIYFFKLPGDRDDLSAFCSNHDIHINQTFIWSGKEDYYSLPNIIPTLKTSKWSLFDEIMSTPLLTFDDVTQIKKKGK